MNNYSSVEAEQSVLGAILIDAKAHHGAIEFSDIDHFTTQAHRAIWSSIERHIRDRLVVDMFSVEQDLDKFGELQSSGGMEYITGICESVRSVDPVLVRQYWKVLDDHKTRRRTEAAALAVLAAVRDIRDIDDMLDEAQSQLNSISQNVNSDTITINNALDGMLARIQMLSELEDGKMVGVTTGVDALDELTMGRQAGFHVIAGRPGMGKTVLAMQAVDKSAMQGYANLVISLEMPTDQLLTRSVSAAASLSMTKLKDPRKMTDEDNMKLATGVTLLKDLPIEYLDKMESKVSRICQTIRAWHRRTTNHGLVVIDYLQLMAMNHKGSTNDAVTEITRRFKMLSNELNIPIIMVSQLNRSLENRPNKRPIPSDLRDSGSIEQDADTITFIYRDEVYDENTSFKGVAELIIAKQRNGQSDVTAYVGAEMHYQRFGNLVNYTPPEPEPKRSKF
jgi:replicative DNA helicase